MRVVENDHHHQIIEVVRIFVKFSAFILIFALVASQLYRWIFLCQSLFFLLLVVCCANIVSNVGCRHVCVSSSISLFSSQVWQAERWFRECELSAASNWMSFNHSDRNTLISSPVVFCSFHYRELSLSDSKLCHSFQVALDELNNLWCLSLLPSLFQEHQLLCHLVSILRLLSPSTLSSFYFLISCYHWQNFPTFPF